MMVAVSASPWGRIARPAIWMMSVTESLGEPNSTESMAGTWVIWSWRVSSQLAPALCSATLGTGGERMDGSGHALLAKVQNYASALPLERVNEGPQADAADHP
jgi:hypothetical protein